MTARLVEKTFAGRPFFVVEPSTIGLPQHTAREFDDLEPTMAEWAKVREGDVVIDAGAHFGVYTLTALAAGARVVAYEPFTDGYVVLSENVKANAWTSRCTVRKFAIWDGQTPYPQALLGKVFVSDYPTAAKIETVTLDDDLARLGVERVDWIKMDIEGAELGALMGAADTLERCRPTLIIEDHDSVDFEPGNPVSDYPKSINSSERIHTMLRGLGYAIEVVRWDVSRKFVVARHPARPARA